MFPVCSASPHHTGPAAGSPVRKGRTNRLSRALGALVQVRLAMIICIPRARCVPLPVSHDRANSIYFNSFPLSLTASCLLSAFFYTSHTLAPPPDPIQFSLTGYTWLRAKTKVHNQVVASGPT